MLGFGLSQGYWWVKLWASEIWEPHGTFLPGSLFLRLTVFSRSLYYFSEEPIFFSLPINKTVSSPSFLEMSPLSGQGHVLITWWHNNTVTARTPR